MTRASLLLAVLFLAFPSIAAAQSSPNAGKPSEPAPQAAAAAADPDVEAMRADLVRMRNLVGQMQRNLGFVDSGLTPLKHQFELEIEMWNVLINDMQRRLNARAEPATAKPSPRPQ